MNSSRAGILLIIVLLTLAEVFVYFKYIRPTIYCKSRILNIVAHPDDDLLFLNPDLSTAISRGDCVTTVFMTSGDAGRGKAYWGLREEGIKAAYSYMSGVKNIWLTKSVLAGSYKFNLTRLKDYQKISLIFIRLPDGNFDGNGFSSNNYESMQKLFNGKLPNIETVDHQNRYTKIALRDLLTSIISSFNPSEIRTQDFMEKFGQGDHSDHYATAFFVKTTIDGSNYKGVLKTYEDYKISAKSINLSKKDSAIKQNVFYLYAKYDRQAISQDYKPWLSRQYSFSFIR